MNYHLKYRKNKIPLLPFDLLKYHLSLAIQMHIPSVQIVYPKMDMNVLILPLTKINFKKGRRINSMTKITAVQPQ